MKNKFLKITAVFALIFALTSCEEHELARLGGEDFVQLSSSAAASIVENDPGSVVTSILLSTSNPNGITVEFTATSNDASRYTISPAPGMVTFAPGESSIDVTITPIDNSTEDGDVVIDLALVETSLPVGIGGQGLQSVTRTVSIIDNDCAFDIDSFVGTYAGVENDGADEYEVTIALGTDPNTLVVSNFFGVNGDPITLVLNPDIGNPTITFIDGEFLYTSGNGTGGVYNPSIRPPATDDRSSYRSCDNFMELFFRVCFLRTNGVACFGESKLELTKI